MRIKIFLLGLLANCILFPLYGQIRVEGVVFADRNGNGVQDAGERLLRSILVSNGDTVVLTDRKGRFELPLQMGQSMFVIAPAGWRTVSTGVTSGAFFYLSATVAAGKLP